ncbi:hypothetical protein D0867_02559 [Hortaea werneckii]|uniref:DUF6697 domain-containing protein n=1 Tax=Hortaea werneckii TaxID=91943 RepID=A0A3M7A5F8_HORWE|nr:hypothetical protein D0867_02559 [Hortaea werneckii]
MPFPTPTYTHPHHQDHQQPHLQSPMQHWTSRPNGLNPRTPGFIPTGMEMQPFHPSSSLPNNTTNSYQITSTNNNTNGFHPSPIPDPATFSDFQNYIYRQHIHHLNGITKLQTASRETDEALFETKEVVKKDLGTLYRLLQQQQKRIDELSLSPLTASAAAAAAASGGGEACEGGDVEQRSLQAVVERRVHGASREPGIWDLEVVEPAVMLERFDRRVVAELYEEQAGKMGELVQRLRGFAALARKEVDEGELGDEVGGMGNGGGSPLVVDGSGVASRDFASGNPGGIADSSEGQTKLRADSKEVETAIQNGGRELSKPSSQLDETERAATSVEQNNTTIEPSTTTPWIPYALRDLQPTSPPLLPDPNQTFTWDFLFNTLFGIQWSPGFYFNPTSSSSSNLPPTTKSYWLLDTPFEPFLPSAPGQPGAKITAFFNDTLPDSEGGGDGRSAAPTEDDYLHTPIFISPDPLDVPADERRYKYFGHYSQKRFSDRIGYDILRERIPDRVLRFWAESLASPERPDWITGQLMRVFWPRPVYEGPVFAEDAGETGSVGSESEEVEGDERVMCALREYARELAEWEREARERVGLLKPQDLLDSFEMSDAAAQPGLRLWWEYFEFAEYDRGFYDGLVEAQEKREEEKSAAAVKAEKKEAAARKGKEEKINPTPAYVKEDARMEKEGNPAHSLAVNAFSAPNGSCDDEEGPNPLTMNYQHPYFPDTNEQPSSPPTPISKAGPKISSSSKLTTAKPKSPDLTNDWSNAPHHDQRTSSPWINNSTSINTTWNPPASPLAEKTDTKKPCHHQPDRNTNAIPETKKKSTTGKHVQPSPTTAGKGAEKPPSHLPNAKALEEARKFRRMLLRRGGDVEVLGGAGRRI